MSEHTPGPWELSRDGCYVTAGRETIAKTGMTCPYEEDFANARLIAQAPAMYEALHDLLTLDSNEHTAEDFARYEGILAACRGEER